MKRPPRLIEKLENRRLLVATLPLSQFDVDLSLPSNWNSTATCVAVDSVGFKTCLDNAQAGDIIELDPDVVYDNADLGIDDRFKISAKGTANNWIVIRPKLDAFAVDKLPDFGGRVGPEHQDYLVEVKGKQRGGDSGRAIDVLPGAEYVRFIGIEFGTPGPSGGPNDPELATVVHLGEASAPITLPSSASTTRETDVLPKHIIFDRVWVHGKDGAQVKNGIVMNGNYVGIVGSYISNITHGSESHALWVNNGEGPFTVENNYLEATGVNVLFGGDDPTVTQNGAPYELRPSDIRVKNNVFSKRWAWRGGPWNIKNLFETKNARRVLLEENVFQNTWGDSQFFAIVIKSTNQLGGCSWCSSVDVTIRNNVMRHTTSALHIVGSGSTPNGTSNERTRRVDVYDNLFYEISKEHHFGAGYAVRLVNDFEDVSIKDNTFIAADGQAGIQITVDRWVSDVNEENDPGQLPFSGASVCTNGPFDLGPWQLTHGCGQNLTVQNNIIPNNEFGALRTPLGGGTNFLNQVVNGTNSLTNNIIYGNTAKGYAPPIQSAYPGNTFAVDEGAIGFSDYANYNYELPSSTIGANVGALCLNAQCKSPDVNRDGLLTVADFDHFWATIAANDNDASYDLDGMSQGGDPVNPDDMVALVMDDDLMNTFFADFDYDQQVAFADFIILSGNFGSSGGWGDGDTDGDGDVDFADFLTHSGNFGLGQN